jgi:hypothetical protein
MEDITEIPYNQNLKLASLDIDNMYPNIPTHELCSIKKECALHKLWMKKLPMNS